MKYPKRCQYKHAKQKKYHVRNWAEYNEGLRRRGDLTVWFDEEAIANWMADKTGKPGGQRVYSDMAIETGLVVRMCSGRQGHSPVGASPTVPVARIRHVAIPQLLGVIPGSLRGVNGPAALRTRAAAVGAIGGPSKHGSLNITECLQPRETSPVEVALQGLNFVSRTCHLEREADASQEGTGERTGRSRRGTGPSAYARIMEITSGSTVFQQEARSNLQRLAVYAKAKPARGFRWGA